MKTFKYKCIGCISMELDKLSDGLAYLVAIAILLAFDLAILVRWADAIYPNILPLMDVGFWDAFPLIGLTLFMGWVTCEVAKDLSKLMPN